MVQNSSITISRGCLEPTLYAIPHTYDYVVDDDMCVCLFRIALGLNINVKKERKLASIENLMNIQGQND
jgi:hypothetical protein